MFDEALGAMPAAPYIPPMIGAETLVPPNTSHADCEPLPDGP